MHEFILNNKRIQTKEPLTTILLDFIRYDQHFKGTKIGCREGDCGACTVLVGSLKGNTVEYRTMTSCLTPLGNIIGKHVVTVEGINAKELTPIQAALERYSATQCGFCTPGFVMSLTNYALSNNGPNAEAAFNSVAGNICRCTGYKSIERAADEIVTELNELSGESYFNNLIEKEYIPNYFKNIPDQLRLLNSTIHNQTGKIIGGGTDLYVQIPDEIYSEPVQFFLNKEAYSFITEKGDFVCIGASTTASDMMNSEIMISYFPKIKQWFQLISSEPIRNMGTLGGNLVNASPIGDLSIFFLALNAELTIQTQNGSEREARLKDFFLAYKTLDLKENEFVKELKFTKPRGDFRFNFEKVSKRTYLDIASVNTALFVQFEDDIISDVHISGGGLAPIPKYFQKTCDFLKGKVVSDNVLNKASEILLFEVSPISDIRGSKEYKSLLMKQLFLVHFEETVV